MSSETEIELCYFCEVRDPSGYDKASATETHEQYQYTLPLTKEGLRRGKIRVRKTVKNGETVYEEVIKKPMNGESSLGDTEFPTTITEAYFKAWRHVFQAEGQSKIRYTFSSNSVKIKFRGEEVVAPPIKFEVDVFVDGRGRKSKWAKVDIEVQELVELLSKQYENVNAAEFHIDFSSLPLDIGQVVSAATKDTEERAAIDNFFKMYSIPYQAEAGNA